MCNGNIANSCDSLDSARISFIWEKECGSLNSRKLERKWTSIHISVVIRKGTSNILREAINQWWKISNPDFPLRSSVFVVLFQDMWQSSPLAVSLLLFVSCCTDRRGWTVVLTAQAGQPTVCMSNQLDVSSFSSVRHFN